MSLKNKVIYQIYPKSFKDTDNNGIGDIQGIIQKIPYLQSLGIDMIWVNPFYPSPQKDNGYDISDYMKIDPIFGDFNDFDELISKLDKAGIGLMMDMVFNHTSTEHEWFQKALKGKKKYQDYYIIRENKAVGPPTNWSSKFGGGAWAPFDHNRSYLHLYDVSQADLNWRNPEVREELYNIVRFWLNKGVKGLRFDVLNVIGKDEILVDADDNEAHEKALYTDTPIVHDYIKELHEKTFGRYPDIVTVGEMSSTSVENAVLYTQAERKELDMIFSFHHLKVDYKDGNKWANKPFDFLTLKKLLWSWQKEMINGHGFMALFWNNHDQPRSNSRFGDPEHYPYETATMLATVLHALKGTPYIFQGEEFGMKNPNFGHIDDYDDIETKNAYRELRKKFSDEEAMSIIQKKSRDNSRTPMAWNNSLHYGFSTATPWLRMPENGITLENDLAHPKSIFRYYQNLIHWRKNSDAVQNGDLVPVYENHPSLMIYERNSDKESLLIIGNFYDKSAEVNLNDYADFQKVFGNGPLSLLSKNTVLSPYETAVFIKSKEVSDV